MTTAPPLTAPSARRTRIGALLWVLSSIQFFAAHLIVQSAWPRPYSWALNNVSDLGAVTCSTAGAEPHVRYVCSPLHDVMNVSFLVQGAMLIAGAVLLPALWRRRAIIAWAGGALLCLQGAGWLVVGLAPADAHEDPHSLGALLVAAGNIGLIVTAVGATRGALRDVRISALLAGTVGCAATWLFATDSDLGLGLGAMERLWLFPVQVWIAYAGIRLLAGTGCLAWTHGDIRADR
ncbi:DUF998 domain-containing protein [Nocardiopsis mangrovi]|uniref:DUF998 domain-containing protein n=1 Tax=Nocardiopsis mangrovi TaxID=1179818 RepID=A0ABV9DPD6_9ACTN